MEPVVTRSLSHGLSRAPSRSNAGRRSTVSYGAEATALFARMTTQPSSTRKGQIDTLISGLVSDGVWAKLNRVYMLAAHDQTESLLNWKSTSFSPLVANGTGGVFTTDRGWTGASATTFYLAPSPSALAAPLTQNNLSIGAWVRSEATENKALMGGGALEIRARQNTSFFPACRLSDATNNASATVPSSIGLIAATHKVTAETTTKQIFKNGAQVGTDITRATVVALPVQAQAILGNTATPQYSDHQVAFAFWGEALTATQMNALYTRVQTFLVAIGAA